MTRRIILTGAGVVAGGVLYLLPIAIVPYAARLVGLAIFGGLLYAIGAARGRRPEPGRYYRSTPYEPNVAAVTPASTRRLELDDGSEQ